MKERIFNTILIVDDDGDFGQSLCNLLFLEEFNPIYANSFEKASEALSQARPSVALIDIRLGNHSGIELLCELKRKDPDLICIMMTGYASEDTAIEALQEGAYDYLRKPFDMKELMAALRRCFEKLTITREKLEAQAGLKKSMEEIQILNRQLEDKVEARTRELKKVQQELIRKAHQAGMAEISASILHNVGNILTSVITSSQLIQSKINSHMKQDVLHRVIARLNASIKALPEVHQTDLTPLPQFFEGFAKLLKKEQKEVQQHAARIEIKTEQINNVVQSQLNYADTNYQVETAYLHELMEDALAIHGSQLTETDVDIEKHYFPVPKIKLVKTRLVHALIHLLKNAWQAMDEKKKLSITIKKDDQWAYIIIMDNGCGIESPNLKRIFQHGFSTQENGKGFGLHNCANAMSEIGGTIGVESEGLGKGAAFTLRLPLVNDSI